MEYGLVQKDRINGDIIWKWTFCSTIRIIYNFSSTIHSSSDSLKISITEDRWTNGLPKIYFARADTSRRGTHYSVRHLGQTNDRLPL